MQSDSLRIDTGVQNDRRAGDGRRRGKHFERYLVRFSVRLGDQEYVVACCERLASRRSLSDDSGPKGGSFGK